MHARPIATTTVSAVPAGIAAPSVYVTVESALSTTEVMYSLPKRVGRQRRAIALTGKPTEQSDRMPVDQYCPIAAQPPTGGPRVVVVATAVEEPGNVDEEDGAAGSAGHSGMRLALALVLTDAT